MDGSSLLGLLRPKSAFLRGRFDKPSKAFPLLRGVRIVFPPPPLPAGRVSRC